MTWIWTLNEYFRKYEQFWSVFWLMCPMLDTSLPYKKPASILFCCSQEPERWLNQSPLNKYKRKLLTFRNLINSLFYIDLFLPWAYEYDMHSSNMYFYILGNKILKSLSKEMNWKVYTASWIKM